MGWISTLQPGWLVEPAIFAAVIVAIVSFCAWAVSRSPESRNRTRTVFLASTVTGLLFVVAAITLQLTGTNVTSTSGLPRPIFLLLSAFLVPTVTIVGWFVSGEIARERDLHLQDAERKKADNERLRRQRDLMIAVRAELVNVVWKYRDFDFDKHRERMIADIERGVGNKPPFAPFVPRISAALLWKGVAADIPLLPEQAVETIVLYYDTRAALILFVEDMNGDAFRALSAHRRANAFKDYIGMLQTLYSYAEAAIDAIDRSLPKLR